MKTIDYNRLRTLESNHGTHNGESFGYLMDALRAYTIPTIILNEDQVEQIENMLIEQGVLIDTDDEKEDPQVSPHNFGG